MILTYTLKNMYFIFFLIKLFGLKKNNFDSLLKNCFIDDKETNEK